MDFADTERTFTLFENDTLRNNKNLVVIKSISKSFGVPGLRLGVIASGNTDLITTIRNDLPIWNINSFAEFYQQIFEKYRTEYQNALEKFRKERKDFMQKLSGVEFLRVLPSQANFAMCEVLKPYNSTQLSKKLLNDYSILVKDMAKKRGLEGMNYIRVAIKNEEENDILIDSLKKILV